MIQKAKTKIFDQYFENIHNKIQKQGSRQCFQYSISFVRKRRKYECIYILLTFKETNGGKKKKKLLPTEEAKNGVEGYE